MSEAGRGGAERPEASDAGLEAPKAAHRHLLSVAELGAEGIEEILRVSDAFVEVGQRASPRCRRCGAGRW